MPFVIQARKVKKNNEILCFYDQKGWVKNRFEAQSYSEREYAKIVRQKLSRSEKELLQGGSKGWRLSEIKINFRIEDKDLKPFFRSMIDEMSQKTGISKKTIRQKLRLFLN